MKSRIALNHFLLDQESQVLTAQYIFMRGLQDLLTAICAILLADAARSPTRPGMTGRFAQAFSRPSLGGLREFAHWLSQENAGQASRLLAEFVLEDSRKGWITSMVELRNKWAHPKEETPESILERAEALVREVPEFSRLGWFDMSENAGPVWDSGGHRLELAPFFWTGHGALMVFSQLHDAKILVRQEETAPTQSKFATLWQRIRREDQALANADIAEIHERMARRVREYDGAQAPWWLKNVLKKGAIGLLVAPETMDGIAAHAGDFWPRASLLDLTLEPGVSPAASMSQTLGLFQPPSIDEFTSWVDKSHRTILILRAEKIAARELGDVLFWLADLYDAGLRDQMRVFIGRSGHLLEDDFPLLEDRMPDDIDQLLRYPPGIEPRILKECLWSMDQKKSFWPF